MMSGRNLKTLIDLTLVLVGSGKILSFNFAIKIFNPFETFMVPQYSPRTKKIYLFLWRLFVRILVFYLQILRHFNFTSDVYVVIEFASNVLVHTRIEKT